jgi:hypothetical protein
MATHSLGYRDFLRVCRAYRRLQGATQVLDLESIRRALITDLEPAHPDLAALLGQLASWEVQTLLQHVERHIASP